MAKIAEEKVVNLDVFQKGSIQWKHCDIPTKPPSSPPKPLVIFTPTVPGAYTVMVFYHGFLLQPSDYCDLLGHIVSHGFIVVAPHLSSWYDFVLIDEIKEAGKVVDWLVKGLQPLLPENVEAKLEKVVLSGHSKGGQTAFCVALGHHVKTMLKFSAVIGIDPVGGLTKCKVSKTSPKILTGVPRSLDLKAPVAVIGTGLGPEKANVLFPPCAPEGKNHVDFFNESKPPCANFVAADYGHMDMLDDETPGTFDTVLSKCLCKNGEGPRMFMRMTVGGLVVAFLRAHLDKQIEDFKAIIKTPSLAPARLVDVKYIPA
ncbi:hypothetical protein V8G54_012402 [Vigna mungo]|uniref:Chlorophyllase n=1 Tax=Vigna mungo TaxID=3915 RepID=A0AAQ3S3S2_VIGMU